MRARDVNSWACEENKIFSPACILNRDELISQLSLETRERQIRIAGSPRWMQMWRVREWKRARRISRAINFTRASTTRHDGDDEGRSPHTANENFAGALSLILSPLRLFTSWTRLPSLIIATFCLGFLFARDANTWEVRKTTKIMSSRLALPVSGPAHKDRDIRTRWLRERFRIHRVHFHVYLAKWGKGREHRRRAYRAKALQTRAGKRSNYMYSVYIGCSTFFLLSYINLELISRGKICS